MSLGNSLSTEQLQQQIFLDALAEKAKREQLRRSNQENSWLHYAPKFEIRTGKKISPFYPYPHQQLLHQIVENHYGTVILKSRQMGITEYFGSRYLFKAKNDPAFAAALFSKNQDDTNDIARRVRNMAANIEEIQFASDSLSYQQILKGGQLYFRPGSKGAGRGLPSIHEELFDEAAYNEEIEEIYAGAIFATEMLGEDARIVFNSTPDAKSGLFFEMLMNGNPDNFDLDKTIEKVVHGELFTNNVPGFYWFRDDAGWAKVFIHWTCHPIYGKDPLYVEKQKKKKKLTNAQAQRDYNLSFLDSSKQVFSFDLIEKAFRGYPDIIPPKNGSRYLIGIDPNQGKEDNFCFVAINVSRRPFVVCDWIYNNKEDVSINLKRCIDKIKRYPNAIIKVEVNAQTLFYEKIQEAFPLRKIQAINTHRRLKVTNTDRLVLLMEEENIIYPENQEFKNEFRNFVQKDNGKREADHGHHDDFVMACAIALDSEEGEITPMEALNILIGVN